MSQNRQEEKRKHRDSEFQELTLLRAKLLITKAQAEHGRLPNSIKSLQTYLKDRSDLSSEQNTAGFCSEIAHKISECFGSWKAVGLVTTLSAAWIGVNALLQNFGITIDPYPYIFLNLALSMLAALTGPVVLMTHNEQQAREDTKNRWFQKLNSLTAKAELEELARQRSKKNPQNLVEIERENISKAHLTQVDLHSQRPENELHFRYQSPHSGC